jgi:hypothetical protein
MECPVCDHVDVDGSGLEPNAALALIVTDVATGQDVLPATGVATDSSGRFSREYGMDLAKHPGLLASLYEPNGADLVLAAHANGQARPTAGGRPPSPTPAPPTACRPGWPPACWARAGCCWWPPAAAPPPPRADPDRAGAGGLESPA